MTFRSNAAERERDQLGTNASAGRVLSFVEVSYNYCNNNNNNIITIIYPVCRINLIKINIYGLHYTTKLYII